MPKIYELKEDADGNISALGDRADRTVATAGVDDTATGTRPGKIVGTVTLNDLTTESAVGAVVAKLEVRR